MTKTTKKPVATQPAVVVYNESCFETVKRIPDMSVDAVITDPPYFLDKLGDEWDPSSMHKVTKSSAVTSLPVGMKFDRAQGHRLQAFMYDLSIELFRILKPGGFYLVMSAPRLVHRLGVAVEDAGFEVRDMWAWLYTQNQVKAMSVERFLDPSGLSDEQLSKVQAELAHWKTPQVKSCLEPIVFAQKPKDGKTFLENWLLHHVGLVDIATGVGIDGGMTTANVLTTGPIESSLDKAFLVPKPTRSEKGATSHVSVKPLALMDQLVRSVTPEGATIYDPFNGSGSTGISAVRLGRRYVGSELAPQYYVETRKRFQREFRDFGFRTVSHARPKHFEGHLSSGQ